ncbi:M23 family metallopeptidase [Patulibacter minatonensis]|uniref:M23 family metallopeptidase n=1 Tax=Patulibacter minatonensis TaxID=298163 RepID=UPI0004B98F61|nr:M23 family metallopeptidase [Patulibacter minatonensis]
MRRPLVALAVTAAALPAAFAGSAQAAPSLDLPFPCGTSMSFKAWHGHSPSDYSIDINGANGHDENGDPVVAPAAGTVISSYFSDSSGYGNNIQIKHGPKTYTLFAHLQDRKVQEGAKVKRGQLIGHIGHTSGTKPVPPHLHYEQRSAPTSSAVVKAVFRGKVAPVYSAFGRAFVLKSRNCGGTPAPTPAPAPTPTPTPTPTTPAAGVPLPAIAKRFVATVRTDEGLPVVGRRGPRSAAAALVRLPTGTKVRIVCQTTGQQVTGKYGTSRIWDLIDLGGGRGAYVTDTYVYTGSDGRVAPTCS